MIITHSEVFLKTLGQVSKEAYEDDTRRKDIREIISNDKVNNINQKNKDKKTKKVTASVIKTKKSKTKQNPWSAFWATSITTVVVFWVLFPFYSYQLQLILDQRQCKGQSNTDPGAGGGGKCLLPHNKHQPPYYPCENGILPDNALDGKKCPEEHVKGPDWFTYMFDHTIVVAEDDPELIGFKHMDQMGVAQVRTVSATGAEKFAEFIYDKVNPFIVEETENRVKVIKVEVREHGKNSAIYEPR